MTGRHSGHDTDDRIQVRPGELRGLRLRDWLIRFGFGAGVSTVAAIVAVVAGPRVGGVFLAFPAILLASLTLVAKEEGVRQARSEARGAQYGTLGLIAFAATIVLLVPRWPMWLVLILASLAWTVVGLGTYLVARRAGRGGAEPPEGE
jgi:uncharacterized membrane protein (GlpM family)